MAARRSKQESPPAPAEAPQADGGWGVAVRVAVSVLVVWHLFVVFISPLSVAPRSELVVHIAQSPYVRWYTDPLYLNHGYHFFGPDPPMGGQHVRYQVLGDDGAVVAEGEFPNLDQQWPRLWYHRHMMLADQMSGIGVFGDPARDRELMMQAYGRHLLRKHDGAQARVQSVFHRSLSPFDVRNELDPDAPEMYDDLGSVVVRREELGVPLLPETAPAGPPEEITIGGGR